MNSRILLITSGAFVDGELAAELGNIPPAFLPAHNSRLYELQHDSLAPSFGKVFISLPATYEVPQADLESLKDRNIEVIPVAPDMTLVQSLTAALAHILASGVESGAGISVLHGDALISDIDLNVYSGFSVGEVDSEYARAGVHIENELVVAVEANTLAAGSRAVLTGYFAFPCLGRLLIEILGAANFEGALQSIIEKESVRALRPTIWYDMGHVHTYFEARKQLTTERGFNSLSFDEGMLVKSSSKSGRIEAEATWYEQLPHALRRFTPHYLGRPTGGAAYALEYLFLCPLSDLFVFGNLSAAAWSRVFEAVEQFLHGAFLIKPPRQETLDTHSLYVEKTRGRLEIFRNSPVGDDYYRFVRETGARSLDDVAASAISKIVSAPTPPVQLVHGDLCFSNILFDFRTRSIKVIDPRGEDARGNPTLFGDPRYDLAKLYHSVIGMYDSVVANRAGAIVNYQFVNAGSMASDAQAEIQRLFMETFLSRNRYGQDQAVIHAISVLLFISMLPLHFDRPKRQQALIANVYRLERMGQLL